MNTTTCARNGLLLGALFLAGCASTQPSGQLIPAVYSTIERQQSDELTVEQRARLAQLCPFGAPERMDYYAREPVTRIVRDGYAMDHNDRYKTPLWVCELVTNEDANGPLTGRSPWQPDPVLCPNGPRRPCERGALDADYTGSGYDRGHLAPNLNQRLDTQRKDETFFFSNAAPQIGKGFNQSVWKNFEEEIARWVQDLGRLWTITGVLYHDEKEDDPQTATGTVYVNTIGAGNVYVPTHFYKVVVWEEDGEYAAFAVVMENERYPAKTSFRSFLKPIRWIEQRLNVDFMPDLEPIDADAIEFGVGRPYR